MSSTEEPLSIVQLRVNREHAEERDQAFLNLQPPFQRDYEPWNEKMRTRLIETIINGLAINPIWVTINDEGDEEVIDGMHRLRTILSFMNNEYPIGQSVRFHHGLVGRLFSDLDTQTKSRIRNFKITLNRVEIKTDEDLQSMWEALNHSSKKLNSYEIQIIPRRPLYDFILQFHEPFSKSAIFSQDTSHRGNLTMKILKVLALTDIDEIISFNSSHDLVDRWIKHRFGNSRDIVQMELDKRREGLITLCNRIYAYMQEFEKRGVFAGDRRRDAIANSIILARTATLVPDMEVFNTNIKRLCSRFTDLLGKNIQEEMGMPNRNAKFQKKLIIHIDDLIKHPIM